MGAIKVKDRCDFEALVDILLRNENQVTVHASMYDDDGDKMENDEIAFYIIELNETSKQ